MLSASWPGQAVSGVSLYCLRHPETPLTTICTFVSRFDSCLRLPRSLPIHQPKTTSSPNTSIQFCYSQVISVPSAPHTGLPSSLASPWGNPKGSSSPCCGDGYIIIVRKLLDLTGIIWSSQVVPCLGSVDILRWISPGYGQSCAL